MSNANTIAVIHPFQQHSFKTAVAIKSNGYNLKYITTVYDKKWSLTHLGLTLLKGEDKVRANNRKSKDIIDSEVVQRCEAIELLLLMLQRIDRGKKLYNRVYRFVLKQFAKQAYGYVKRKHIKTIIVYDIVSADLIKLIKENGLNTTIVLDMSAPYYNFMEKQFRIDIEKNPDNREITEKNLEDPLQSYKRDYGSYEIQNADAFLVASEFTRKSLVDSGVSDDKIYTCRYGIDDFCSTKLDTHTKDGSLALRVMYAGNINRQKGAYQLIRVANSLPPEKYKFSFYGYYQADDNVYVDNMVKHTFKGHVPRNEMKQAYMNTDIFVFPTLADGFGFVVAEALSYGVPVVASLNAGASDLIQEGKNGFLFEAGNDAELKKILECFESDRSLLEKMKTECLNSISTVTWKKYYDDVGKALKEILYDNKE